MRKPTNQNDSKMMRKRATFRWEGERMNERSLFMRIKQSRILNKAIRKLRYVSIKSPLSLLQYCKAKIVNISQQLRQGIRKMLEPKIPEMNQNMELPPKILIQVKNYIIYDHALGRNMESVYLCVDKVSCQKYAAKISTKISKASNEAYFLNQLRSPNIIKMKQHILDKKEGFSIIILEYCTRNLSQQILLGTPRNKLLKYFSDVVNGVIQLEKRMIVHRDLSLENIMIDDNDCAKIIDFDRAKKLEYYNHQISQSAFRLKPNYATPPQFTTGQRIIINRNTDVWSLAIILSVILYEQIPFNILIPRFPVPNFDAMIVNYHDLRPHICHYEPLDTLIDNAIAIDYTKRISLREFITQFKSINSQQIQSMIAAKEISDSERPPKSLSLRIYDAVQTKLIFGVELDYLGIMNELYKKKRNQERQKWIMNKIGKRIFKIFMQAKECFLQKYDMVNAARSQDQIRKIFNML